jgi:hypothetical protein
VVLTSSPASPAAISHRGAYSLTWTSEGADVCVGAEATLGGVATTVNNWTGAHLEPNPSAPLSLFLDGPATQQDPDNEYAFRLRCYGTGGSLLSNQVSVAVDGQSGGGSAADYCLELYGATPPSDRPFNLTRQEMGYDEIWSGVIPGQPAGRRTLPGEVMSPSTDKYLAIRFVMPEGGTDPDMSMSTQLPQVGGVESGAISLSISPCPGDFRPRTTNSDPDPYKRPQCGAFGVGFSLRASSSVSTSGCPAPANKVMYLNIAVYDMFGSSLGSPSCVNSASTCGLSVVTQ